MNATPHQLFFHERKSIFGKSLFRFHFYFFLNHKWCCLQLVIERAAAVVGNLSTTDQFFSAIREAGAIQRLVRLLDSGSTNRTTEIAAKTLANLASESSNRKGIRLAGGVPPLMRLLMDKPSEQVSIPHK